MPPKTARPEDAFASEQWRVFTDALFDTLGIAVTVADLSSGAIVHAGPRGAYCGLLSDGGSTGLLECFDEIPEAAAHDISKVACRLGMPCFVAPVEIPGPSSLHVIVEGFVTSTRERRRLFEQLVARGSSESEARLAVRDVPVHSARKALRFTELVAAQARGVAGACAEGAESERRIAELGSLVDAGRDFADTLVGYRDLPAVVLERGTRLLDAQDACLMIRRPGTDVLEVAATRGSNRTAAPGATCRVGDGVPGRVAQTGRSVLLTGGAGWPSTGGHPVVASISSPLHRAGETVGVLSFGFTDPDRSLGAEDIGLVERYAEFAASALDRAKVHEGERRELIELVQLNEVARIIHGDIGIEEIITVTASIMDKALDFDLGGIAMTGHGLERVTVVVRSVVSEADVDAVLEEAVGLPCDDGFVRTYVAHLGEVRGGGSHPDWSVLSAPLMARGVVIGFLFAASAEPGSFDAHAERLLNRLADHVAIAVDRAVLFGRLRTDYARTIAALSAALDAGEYRENGHSERVMDYAMAIAEQMELTLEEVELLRFAGLLHDVGKIGLSGEILLKPSKLSPEEMQKVRMHSEIGAGLLEQIDFLNAIAPIILHHHERWDGRGYPMGLAGADIPLLARILCVADSFDAMTHTTPYRTGMTLTEARDELFRGIGTQFDPKAARAFLDVFDAKRTAGMTGLFSEAARRQPHLPS
ncbi:MAG: hypothetical protein C0418_02690 [Coriobacteriaceae bacterium]|nr:hypothetical protein [Coriobacteriaceae bacterium]